MPKRNILSCTTFNKGEIKQPYMPPLLEVKQLSKKYDGNEQSAVHDVSFRLEEGQVMSLTGESGSGKTTLLKLVGGLLEPDTGEVLLAGEKVKGPKARLVAGHPDIKFVFQHYNLSPNITVRQNIAHILNAYVAEYRDERTEELIRLCKLSPLAESYPRELSGGEKQRVALARAIAEEPRLLLMDEPFSNLDISLKKHLKDEITEILDAFKITAIIVTHDPQDALSMAEKVAVMQSGQLLQMASPDTIYRQPTNAYVAQLFGTCNFLDKENARVLVEKADPGHMVCLRAEDIELGEALEGSPTALVKKINYMGAFQEVKLEINQQIIRSHHRSNHIREGDKVGLSIKPEKVIYLA